MKESELQVIEMRPIGHVRRAGPDEDERDRSLMCEIVLVEELAGALDGLDEWSHVYIIYWLSDVPRPEKPIVHFPSNKAGSDRLGILATRAPIHPNPIGLTLVRLIRREKNMLQVQGLDAYDGTPILDIKPYPDWERGQFIVVTDFRVPEWVRNIVRQESTPADRQPSPGVM